MWGDMVVLFCVWTLLLILFTVIILIFLKRETQKFHQRLAKGLIRHEIVTKMHELDAIMARYVNHLLKQGSLYNPISSLSHQDDDDTEVSIKAEAIKWFQAKITELQDQKYSEAVIKTSILSAIKSGLTIHPLDLRGSRRALEAAKIFLHPQVQVELETDKASFLESSVSLQATPEDKFSCPTTACDAISLRFLQCLEICLTRPNTASLIFVIFSFLIWFYDIITDLVVINVYWNLELATGIQYPSYQTLTVDLYAPLLLLVLLISLMLTVFSGSCSDLVSCYVTLKSLSQPEEELKKKEDKDPTRVISRYNFNIFHASSASLLQFCLQFTSYILIIHMLEALKDETKEEFLKTNIQEKLDQISFLSLWFSGFGSFISLVIAQYNGFKIQHEHCMTLTQRIVYVLCCIFNTISIMAALLTFTTAFILPITKYVGRYHLMIIVIFVAVIVIIGALVSVILHALGMDLDAFDTDRIIVKFKTNNLVTSLVHFTQTGEKSFSSFLGASSVFGRILSLITVNFYLPPSQLLTHPFRKFFITSPRSPALHHTIAKHLIYYNVLMIVASILLCASLSQFEQYATKNLLIFANLCGFPCLLISYLLLFRYYKTYDIWTSNGVHLVFHEGGSEELLDDQGGMEDGDQTQDTFLENSNNPFHEDVAEKSFGPLTMEDESHDESHDELSDEDFDNHMHGEVPPVDCGGSEESQDSRDESSRHLESSENPQDTNPFKDPTKQPVSQEENTLDSTLINPFVEVVDENAMTTTTENVESSDNIVVQVADVHDSEVAKAENATNEKIENSENSEDWVVVEQDADTSKEVKIDDKHLDNNKTNDDPTTVNEDSGDESSQQPLKENLLKKDGNEQNTNVVETDMKETTPLLAQKENTEDKIEIKQDEPNSKGPQSIDDKETESVTTEETKAELMKNKSKQVLVSMKSISESTKQNIQAATKKFNDKSSAATKQINEQRIASTKRFNEHRRSSTKKFNEQRRASAKILNEGTVAARQAFNKSVLKNRSVDCVVEVEEYLTVGRWVDVSEE